MEDDKEPRPESLLPYEDWTEDAMRQVMLRALSHVAAHGLPGDHHFYITFRTDHPGTVVPPRVRVQYPQEMTIVLQHQFWDLSVDEASGMLGVGLSFGGVPASLRIPILAVTAFADPFARFGVRFHTELSPAAANEEPSSDAEQPQTQAAESEPSEAPQVVSLDAFRRRTPPKDT